MTTRNFKQCGQAYGSTPASITATIDGTVVYSGPISTLNTPVPSRPSLAHIAPTIFTWANTVEFAGTQSFSIAVTGSPLLLDKTQADYCDPRNIAQFGEYFYSYEIGGVIVYDPFTNVTIDGAVIQRGPDNTLSGQWQWLIPAGSTFTATLNVNAGFLPPPA